MNSNICTHVHTYTHTWYLAIDNQMFKLTEETMMAGCNWVSVSDGVIYETLVLFSELCGANAGYCCFVEQLVNLNGWSKMCLLVLGRACRRNKPRNDQTRSLKKKKIINKLNISDLLFVFSVTMLFVSSFVFNKWRCQRFKLLAIDSITEELSLILMTWDSLMCR